MMQLSTIALAGSPPWVSNNSISVHVRPRLFLCRPHPCHRRAGATKLCPPVHDGGFSFNHAESLLTLKPFNGARDFGPVQCSNQSGYRFLWVAGASWFQMFSDDSARVL